MSTTPGRIPPRVAAREAALTSDRGKREALLEVAAEREAEATDDADSTGSGDGDTLARDHGAPEN